MKDKVIIIPVHNQLSYLIKCIDSIVENTKKFKLIIVNDGSTDNETSDWINKNLVNHHIITHTKPLGFSMACNDGIDYAMRNFDFNCLCVLNSDTEIVTNNWFNIVEKKYSSNEKIGIAGVVSDNATFQTITNVPLYMKNINNKPTLETKLVHGFCFFISKKLINTIGRFDNDMFPHYGSEDDYSLKAVQYGFKNIIVGSVFVKHIGSMSYTPKLRLNITSKSLPDLFNRWGKEYVKKCVNETNNIMKTINS